MLPSSLAPKVGLAQLIFKWFPAVHLARVHGSNQFRAHLKQTLNEKAVKKAAADGKCQHQ